MPEYSYQASNAAQKPGGWGCPDSVPSSFLSPSCRRDLMQCPALPGSLVENPLTVVASQHAIEEEAAARYVTYLTDLYQAYQRQCADIQKLKAGLLDKFGPEHLGKIQSSIRLFPLAAKYKVNFMPPSIEVPTYADYLADPEQLHPEGDCRYEADRQLAYFALLDGATACNCEIEQVYAAILLHWEVFYEPASFVCGGNGQERTPSPLANAQSSLPVSPPAKRVKYGCNHRLFFDVSRAVHSHNLDCAEQAVSPTTPL